MITGNPKPSVALATRSPRARPEDLDLSISVLEFQLSKVGFPIRKSADQSSFAAHHGLSQRITSFIASQRQGIHRMLLRHLIVLMIDVREFKLAKTYDQKDHLCLPNTHDFAAGPINLGQRARCRMSSSRICSLFTMTNSSADPLARTTKPKMFPGFGGARRDRTDDLKLAKLPLSQLSYGPF